jgi:hypothetical protein
MQTATGGWWLSVAIVAVAAAPANATVNIVSFAPNLASPQPVGATISWTVNATDTNPGPLTFQFNVAPPRGVLATVKQFNAGTLSGGMWKSLPFSWALTGLDGTYQVQVVVKDFGSGESDSQTVSFIASSPVTGANPVVLKTQNPLVALFVAPACAGGSLMRVSFAPQSGRASATTTNWAGCHPPSVMTFEIAGMYPNSTYNLFAQVSTAGKIVNGPAAGFITGPLPSNFSI